MDSPRGRVYLMEGLADGTMELNATVVQHFDRCLGCMACLTSCPSGVQYDKLIEQTRTLIESEFRRPPASRALRAMVFEVFPNPGRLRAALKLAPLGKRMPVPSALAPLLQLAPSWKPTKERPAELTPAAGEKRGRVGLLTGCVQSVLFGDVNAATARVLAAEGYEVVAPADQACCGALSIHAGRHDDGLARARRTIETFEKAGVDFVISNAAGCGSNLKDYGYLLASDSEYAEQAHRFSERVLDVQELLAQEPPRADRGALELRVAFQDSCHLAHAQRVRSAPRAVLRTIPGVEIAEPANQDICCGSAGIYNLTQPEAATELGSRKAEAVLATNADVYASANPGCLVQVSAALRREGHPLPSVHPIELVDASIRGASVREILESARR